MKNTKFKFFPLISKLEKEGWKLIRVDSNTIISGEGYIEWFAIMLRDGIFVYLEAEPEDVIFTMDVNMLCPQCSRPQYDGTKDEGGDFCPDCDKAFVYKKEISDEYNEYKNSLAR